MIGLGLSKTVLALVGAGVLLAAIALFPFCR